MPDPITWLIENQESVLALTTGLFFAAWAVAMVTRKRPKREYKTLRTETAATIITEREL